VALPNLKGTGQIGHFLVYRFRTPSGRGLITRKLRPVSACAIRLLSRSLDLARYAGTLIS
jgi:hypothetical protein